MKPSYLDLSEESTIALTYDNNLVYFEKNSNTIGCYSLLGKKLVQEKKVEDFSESLVTRIVISGDNESYFIGCEDGSVHVIKSLDFSYITKY